MNSVLVFKFLVIQFNWLLMGPLWDDPVTMSVCSKVTGRVDL